MKNLLGMMPVIGLALTLTACGGSSSSSGNDNYIDNSDNGTVESQELFDGSTTAYAYKIGLDITKTEKAIYTRQGDMLYVNSSLPGKGFSSYILTEDTLYVPETPITVNADQKIRDSFIKSIQNNEWKYTPFNQQGLKKLEITQKFAVTDLAGQAIAPVVAPSDTAFVSFHQDDPEYSNLKLSLISRIAVNQPTFPQGATCLQSVSTSYSEKYLSFQPDDLTSVVQNAGSLQDWANLAYSYGITASNLVEKHSWAGYNWGAITLKDYDSQGNVQYIFAVEYQGKVYQAQPKGDSQTYTELLTNYRQQLLAEKVDPQLIDMVIGNLKNSCTIYNEVAAEAIDEAIKKAADTPVKIDIPVDLTDVETIPNCYGNMTFC